LKTERATFNDETDLLHKLPHGGQGGVQGAVCRAVGSVSASILRFGIRVLKFSDATAD